MGVLPFIGLPKVLSQWERRAPCWTIGRHKTSFFNLFCLAATRWADDAKACSCVVWCLFRGGDAACFRAATAWRSIFFGKTLYSLRWQPETDECVSATGFVKIRVCILTCCKNRVKPSYFNYDTASNFFHGGLFLRPAFPLKIDAT